MIKKFICTIAMLILPLNMAPAQSTKQDKEKNDKQSTQTGQPAQATGIGTRNRIAKWTTSATLGDSNITEDKSGNVGIGTDKPASLLTIGGMIETTFGGIKFPDGTVQTTAGGVVIHNETLKGDGTPASPLEVAAPLELAGSAGLARAVLAVTNTGRGGNGMFSQGGEGTSNVPAGMGLLVLGGFGNQTPGGIGISVFGGRSTNQNAGDGGQMTGGSSGGRSGGNGLLVTGGSGTGAGNHGGIGIVASGGEGTEGATKGLAGKFNGDVEVTGKLSKGGGSFRIDHPLDPENKYLSHSFVESPDMMNIYNGNITTDANGEAVVELPEWFETLNRDFRYQLTVIGTFAQAIVAEKVKGNRFTIQTSIPGVEVSWQVTGIRQDAWANKNRIPVEEKKSESERGLYLHPDAFNKPEEQGIQPVRNPEQMRELKQRRQQADRDKQK